MTNIPFVHSWLDARYLCRSPRWWWGNGLSW